MALDSVAAEWVPELTARVVRAAYEPAMRAQRPRPAAGTLAAAIRAAGAAGAVF